jgi:glycosyltransferase involved in cell wall biosynthesis
MENYDKVSILMSVYFKEDPENFKSCLQSMVDQTLKADEIVLVKDGPLTNELEAVIDEYAKKYEDLLKVVTLDQNVGLGEALNIGIQKCSNQLIARMDTDDIAVADRIEKQASYLALHPETAIVGSDIIEFETSIDNVIAHRIVPHTHDEIISFASRRNPFNHMTVMYRKDAVLQAGNYLPINGYEDYYLWVRMLKAGVRAHNLSEVLVYARAGYDMYYRRGGWKYLLDGFKALNQIYEVGLMSKKDFTIRLVGQIVVNSVPNKLRGFFYTNFLRKN